MRHGWEGNTELKRRVHQHDPDVREIVEAVVETDETRINTFDEWNAADSTTNFTILKDGGAKLTGTVTEHEASPDQTATASVISDLDRESPWHVLDITWPFGSGDKEFHELEVHIDPDVDGTGKNVDSIKCQLYRVSNVVTDGSDTDNRGISPGGFPMRTGELDLTPISGVAEVFITSNATDTFTFDFTSTSQVPRTGDPPNSPVPDIANRPRTIIFVWAVQSDGSSASNIAWLGDSTSDGEEGNIVHRTLEAIDDSPEVIQTFSRVETRPKKSGMPRFKLQGRTYTERTISFTAAANRLDFGSAPDASNDLEIVAGAELPQGTDVTYEIKAPADASWTEVADGDVIGKDNTSDGGNDLSSLAERQDYDARAILTPSGDKFSTPIARFIGVRELTIENLDGRASVQSVRYGFDPIDLVAEIPEATIEIIRDGRVDYRDAASEIFAGNHIGDVEFRVFIGHDELDRKNWLHIDTYIVDDYDSQGASIEVTCVSPTAELKAAVPPYDAVNDRREVTTYESATLKAVWEDLIDNQIALNGRYRGPGVEDGTTTVSRILRDSDGKSEVDAISYLAGGVTISSQGKVKFTRVFDNSPPIVGLPQQEVAERALTPGYRSRLDEFFVPYSWSDENDEYASEVRAFHTASITKLGRARIDPPESLDDTTARWIDSTSLAESVAGRTIAEYGPGLPMIRFDSTYPQPHLEVGDNIAVETDRLVMRDPNNDRDLRGLMWLVGTVVEVGDVWGKRLSVWIRTITDTVPSEVDGNRQGFVSPEVVSATADVDEGGGVSLTVNVNEAANAIRYAVSTSSYPTKATTQSGTLEATTDGVFDANFGIQTINPEQTAFISILAYENADGSGAESPEVHKVKVRRDQVIVPTITLDPTQSGSTGTFSVTIEDPQNRANQDAEFQKRENGSWSGTWVSTWDTSTGTAGTDDTLTRSEDITLTKKHPPSMKVRIRYTAEDGGNRYVGAEHSFDIDVEPEVKRLTVSIDENDNVVTSGERDEDGATVYFTVGVADTIAGSIPSDPTAASHDASTSSLRWEGLDTTVNATDGNQIVSLKAKAETSGDTLGPLAFATTWRFSVDASELPRTATDPTTTDHAFFKDNPGDPNTLDSVNDGTSFGRLVKTALNASGQLDFSSGDVINKAPENLDGTTFTGFDIGTLANRPAAGQADRLYLATDGGVNNNPVLFRDDGAAWQTEAVTDLADALAASVGDLQSGGNLPSGTQDSGGRDVTDFFGKSTDVLGDVDDGGGFSKVLDGGVDGSGNLDLAGTAWVNKNAENLDRTSTNNTPVSDVLSKMFDGGDLDSNARQGDTAGNTFSINRHTEKGTDTDTSSVSFSNSYDSTPAVVFVPQSGLAFKQSFGTSADQKIEMKADSPSVSGFTMHAKIKSGTTSTDQTDGFSSSQNASAPENGDVTITSDGATAFSNLEDADGNSTTYTAFFDVGSSTDTSSDTFDVILEYNDGATSTTWTEGDRKQYSGQVSLSDESLSFAAALGTDYDLRLRLEITTGDYTDTGDVVTVTAHGEDNTQPGVEYTTQSGGSTDTMTPDTGDKVAWEAKETA